MPQQSSASGQQLGVLVAEYRGRYRFVPVERYFSLMLGILVLVGLFFASVSIMGDTFTEYFVAAIVAAGVIWLLLWIIATHRRRILVFTDGFVYSGLFGRDVCRWADIEGVWQSVTNHYIRRYGRTSFAGTAHVYTILRNDGKKLRLNDGVRDIALLGETIQSEVFLRLLPRNAERFNRGDTLSFGPLRIDRQGLHTGRQTLPWREVASAIIVQDGWLWITRTGQPPTTWVRLDAVSIPNLAILLSLTDDILGLAGWRNAS